MASARGFIGRAALVGGVGGDVGAHRFVVGQPGSRDVRCNRVVIQRLLKQTQAPIELAPHDAVVSVGLGQGASFVGRRPAQVCDGELRFQSLESILVDRSKEEADHHIRGHPLDEIVNDGPDALVAPQALVR